MIYYAAFFIYGALNEIQIDSSGIITGIYTNGIRRPEAQVAVAHFANLPGLLKTGQNLYKESDNSGVPVINDAEKFGVTITAGALEMSNVDLSNEFADLLAHNQLHSTSLLHPRRNNHHIPPDW